MSASVNVFSTVPYPLTVSHSLGKKSKTRNTVKIMAGRNRVDAQVWDEIKDVPQVKARLDKGYMRASEDLSGDLKQKEKIDLLGTPSRGFIGELCQKSAPIPTGAKNKGDRDFYTLEEQRERGLL